MAHPRRQITGRIFDVQRFSIHDGPGIRTTVFLKGCPLRCIWCHNPEGMSPGSLLSFLPDRCIGCGYCMRACRNGAHRMDPQKGHVIDRDRCVVCGLCAEECYSGALELVGRDATVQEVLDEVLRDRAFYETSGGGMTLSGGEPLMQIDFSAVLLAAARDEGLHCAVETCGHVDFARFERVLSCVDLFLYDVKETDEQRHVDYTGVSNERILRNLKDLHDRGAAILIRLPIIPGLNDREEHFRAIADLARTMPNLEGVEIMPYHRLGVGKRERFGLGPDRLTDVAAPDQETVAGYVSFLRDLGVKVRNEVVV